MGFEFDWRAHVTTAASLQKQSFPPVRYVVDGLIPEGLTLLAGPPKIGKSWLMLDIALGIATGETCLDGRGVVQGDVLYCALEDNRRRLQHRIESLYPDQSEWPERLELATNWDRLDRAGLKALNDWADSFDEDTPRLVIFDTLERVRALRSNKDPYSDDYGAVEGLHRFSNERGIPVIVTHHTRKALAEDPIDRVSGTLGLTGGVDTIMVLDRTGQGTTLFVRGRDVEEAKHAVAFDKKTYRWRILGDAEEVHRSDIRTDILDALRDATKPLGPTAIGTILGKSPDTLKQRLHQMQKDGEVIKHGRGKYVHPDNEIANAP